MKKPPKSPGEHALITINGKLWQIRRVSRDRQGRATTLHVSTILPHPTKVFQLAKAEFDVSQVDWDAYVPAKWSKRKS